MLETIKRVAKNKWAQMATVAIASFMLGGGAAKAVDKKKKK